MILFQKLKPSVSFLLLLSLAIVNSTDLYSQEDTKNEFEKRVDKEDFPAQSIELLQPFLKKSKNEKYYQEYDGVNYFYEVKLLYKFKNLSIKFTDEGALVDIESLYSFDELPNNIQKKIVAYFEENYKKYKIKRTQIQYNREIEDDGELESDSEYIEDFLEKDDDLIIRYELEAEVLQKDTKAPDFFEFTFDEKGELINQRKTIQRDADNILY